MGDEITGQQFVTGGHHGLKIHPHHGGHGGVAVERQAVLVGHGTSTKLQRRGGAGEGAACSRTKRQ